MFDFFLFFVGVAFGVLMCSITASWVEQRREIQSVWNAREKEMNERHARVKQTIEEMRQRMMT